VTPEDEKALRFHGAQIAQMLIYWDWVYRRVEQISFVDTRTARRRISVDFRLPKSYADISTVRGASRYVPLTLQRKERPLVDFDLFDEDSRSLPLIGRAETQRVAQAVLVGTAASILKKHNRSLGTELSEDLQHVVECEAGEAKLAIRNALQPRNGLDDRRFLAGDNFMPRLVSDLAKSFLLITPVSDPRKRRVIKFSFLEESELPHLKMKMRLGWRAIPFKFLTGGVGKAQSFHCEISAPPNLEVVGADLSAERRSGPTVSQSSTTVGERVHLQLYGVTSDATGLLEAQLRASRPGMPSTAAAFAIGVSLLLTAGAIFHWRNGADSTDTGSTAAALLVAIPALLAAYLSRPEHQLASRLLRGIRRLTAGVGLLAFVAAASTIVLRPTFAAWAPIAGAAWVLSLALVFSAVLPRVPRPAKPRESA
jgi:hypothetical protein